MLKVCINVIAVINAVGIKCTDLRTVYRHLALRGQHGYVVMHIIKLLKIVDGHFIFLFLEKREWIMTGKTQQLAVLAARV